MYRLFAILALSALPVWAPAADFVPLDIPGSQLAALSHDGCVAAGTVLGGGLGNHSAGFRWMQTAGAEALPGAITVRGLSANGDYVAGSTLDEMQRQVASYWDAAGTLHRIESMPGIDTIGVISQAYAVSNEPRVVGSARRPGNNRGSIAFQWTAETGMHSLPFSSDDTAARALAISTDGQRIAGWEQVDGQPRAVLWRNGEVSPLRAEIPDYILGEVLGSSHDTDVLVGLVWGVGTETNRIYRWHAENGGQVLEPPSINSPLTSNLPVRLYASSDDGAVLVGGAGQGLHSDPWVWLEDLGFLTLDQLLKRHGVTLPADWQPLMLTAISGNGRRLGGWGKYAGDRLDSFVIDLGGGDCV